MDGRPSRVARIYGLGSVYGKALRDSRRGTMVAAGGLSLLLVVTASQVAAEFGTAAARAAMAQLPLQLPAIFRGLLGEPFDIASLSGFLSWRTVNVMPILLGAWSIAVLSNTLAGEAARGSLDLVATTPHARTSIALQKAAAFATALAVVCLVTGVVAWASSVAFATLPGDEATLTEGLSHAAWLFAVSLFPGAIAWLAGPVLGRGGGAGVGAAVMLASFLAHGYRDAIAVFGALDAGSYFGWTARHRPLAGATDPAPVVVLIAGGFAVLVAGALLFRIRDIGVTVRLATPFPRIRLGLRGVTGRSFADRLPVALAWGIGIGAMGFVFALNLDAMRAVFASLPQIQQIVERFYPGFDILSAGGLLQLVFFGFGAFVIAAAAGMLAAGWASDETQGRLELLLSAPMARSAWALRSGFGVLLAVVAMAVAISILVGIGTAAAGADATTPAVGVLILGLYGAALVGAGLAAGGVVSASLAGGVAGGLGLAFYLLDTIGTGLRLPESVLDLSLSRHLGQPMAGVYDEAGLVACGVVAVGGVVVSALGYARRDIAR